MSTHYRVFIWRVHAFRCDFSREASDFKASLAAVIKKMQFCVVAVLSL